MVDYPVQRDVEVYVLGVLLFLVGNDGQHEAFPIGSVSGAMDWGGGLWYAYRTLAILDGGDNTRGTTGHDQLG